jgi:hypothetical protein
LSREFDGAGVPLNRLVASHFDDGQDVYCHLDVDIDLKKYVKPVEVKPKEQKSTPVEVTLDKFKTVTKYSFFESGKNWVKVLLEFPGIKDHPKDKIKCSFTNRTLHVQVFDFKGANY